MKKVDYVIIAKTIDEFKDYQDKMECLPTETALNAKQIGKSESGRLIIVCELDSSGKIPIAYIICEPKEIKIDRQALMAREFNSSSMVNKKDIKPIVVKDLF